MLRGLLPCLTSVGKIQAWREVALHLQLLVGVAQEEQLPLQLKASADGLHPPFFARSCVCI